MRPTHILRHQDSASVAPVIATGNAPGDKLNDKEGKAIGYDIYINDCSIVIPPEKHDAALAALRAHDAAAARDYERFDIGEQDTLVYDLEDRYQLYAHTEPGYEGGFYFDGEWFRNGQTDEYFTVLAPFIDEGGTIDWEGEDGDRWRYYFKGGKLHSVDAVVTYPEPD